MGQRVFLTDSIFVAMDMLIPLGLALSAAVDTVIALLLLFFLFQCQTEFKSTNRVVYKIAAYTFNSGLLTMCGSISALIIFLIFQGSLLWMSLEMLTAKLYANSFLGYLNARKHLRKQLDLPVTYNNQGVSELMFSPNRTTHPEREPGVIASAEERGGKVWPDTVLAVRRSEGTEA